MEVNKLERRSLMCMLFGFFIKFPNQQVQDGAVRDEGARKEGVFVSQTLQRVQVRFLEEFVINETCGRSRS